MKKMNLFPNAVCMAVLLACGCGREATVKSAEKDGSDTGNGAAASVKLPMDCFKRFRKAAVDNEITPLLSITDGALLSEVKQHGLPPRIRKAMTLVTAAYEDIYVRQGNPSEALVRALFEEKGRDMCMDVKIAVDGSICKITDVEIAPYTPLRDMENFLSVCEKNDSGSFAAMSSGAFKEKYPNIPAGLTTPADNRTAMAGGTDSGRAKLSVNRNGLKGTFTMRKENSIWKVVDMDECFAKPMPISAAKSFFAAVKDKKADELEKIAAEELLKEKILENESLSSRFQSVKIASERITGASAEVKGTFDTDKEEGSITVSLISKEDGWRVSSVSFPTVNAKKTEAPAAEGGAPQPEGAADPQ